MTSVSRGPDPARPAGTDPIPLLPRGSVVFEDIPIRAIVVEALTGVIGDGTMVVRDGDRGAVILIRGGDVWEVHVVESEVWRTGSGLLKSLQSWADASVWAERLDSPLVDLCAALLRGETLYDDLRLMWVNWPSLLSDLGRRGGTYVVEITTPVGRGVTCVTAGRQALSYTDIHPSLGDPALLEAMASNQEGSVRVRRVGEEGFAGAQAQAMERAAAAPRAGEAPADSRAAGAERPRAAAAGQPEEQAQPAAADPLPGMSWVAPWETTWRPDADPGSAGNGGGAGSTAAASTATGSTGNGGSAQPIAAAAAPSTWREFAATTIQAEQAPTPRAETSGAGPSAEAAAGRAAESNSVAEVLDDLRSIARRRLQLSAPRVESVLDEGAAERRSLGSVLEEIRGMSIRGVMPATVDEMVDEMAAAASRSSG